VNRRTDNTISKRKRTKGQKTIYNNLYEIPQRRNEVYSMNPDFSFAVLLSDMLTIVDSSMCILTAVRNMLSCLCSYSSGWI